MNFYDFFYLWEATFGGEDPMQMNVDDIQLTGGHGSLQYHFEMDNERYTVNFGQTEVYVPGIGNLSNKGYGISLQGPRGYSLTGRGKAMTVYKSLIKAVKKLIDQENPDGLVFAGAYPEQDLMYSIFYEKYLHQAYTQVSKETYVSNKLIERMRDSNDPKWPALQAAIERDNSERPQRVERLRQHKEGGRRRRQELAERMGQLSQAKNKIAWIGGRPGYITDIDSGSGNVSYYYTSGSYLDSNSTDYQHVEPIDQMPAERRHFKSLKRLIKRLQSDRYLTGEPQFYGNPPAGWDQDQADPMAGIEGKIAYNDSYGPIYITNYNDEAEEISFYYMSGRYTESGYVNASQVQKIDEMPVEHTNNLRRLIKYVKRDYGEPSFYGTPPQGWDTPQQPHQALGKIAWSQYFARYVYVNPNQQDDSDLIVQYLDYRNALTENRVDESDIKPVDSVEATELRLTKLRALVQALRQAGIQPQFYGNAPQGLEQGQGTNVRTAVNKVVLVNGRPVYVRAFNGPMMSGFTLNNGRLEQTVIQPNDVKSWRGANVSPELRTAARDLITALYQQGTRAELWMGE